MKIAILGSRGIPAKYGGFETFAEALALGLAERGVDVTVYCERPDENLARQFSGVHLRYMPAPKVGAFSTLLFDLRCLWDARRGFDVVYMLGYGAAIFCWLPRLSGTRVWINPDGVEWARSKWGRLARTWLKWMEWAAVHVSNLLIADSKAIRDHLLRRYGTLKACKVIAYGAPRITAAPDPIDLRTFGVEPGAYFLIVCRIEPENHVRELVQGFLQSGSDRELVVVGDHNVRSRYCMALARDGFLEHKRIRFVGPIYNPSLLASLRYHCFAYLHGHSVGGTNPSLLEALACGNVVIAHDNPFNREVAGSIANYFGSTNDIARLINEAEKMPLHERSTVRVRAQHTAASKYSWDAVISTYFALLYNDSVASGS